MAFHSISKLISVTCLWLLVIGSGFGTDLFAQISAGRQVADLESAEIEQKPGAELSLELEFTDEKGERVRLGDYLVDQPAVLAFVYYECPMLCTEVLNGLLRALRAMELEPGKDFQVVTVSIDPGETPALALEKKQQYLKRYGRSAAADGWHFLTGEEANIRRLADQAGFGYSYVPETDLYTHAAAILVLTPSGRVSRYLFGVEYAPRDLRLGLVEASSNRIGGIVDQVLLYCYRYDPSSGRYTLVIMNVLRLAGGLTVLLLGGFVVLMLIRERRQAGKGATDAAAGLDVSKG